MKTKYSILSKIILSSGLVVALAFVSGCATDTSTSDQMRPMKGGEHLLMLQGINTQAEADAIRPDDSFAMVCGKCKTVYVTRVKQGTKGAQLLIGPEPTELIGTHMCIGCRGTWTITGAGKSATSELKHSCTVCGDNSGFCCATKPGGGPTQGMEK